MLPRILLLVAVVIWGWTFVATKILVPELGPIEIFGSLRRLRGPGEHPRAGDRSLPAGAD